MTKRITIREKKIAIIREQVKHMHETLAKLDIDDNKYNNDKELWQATMDAHFESLRVSSGNLSLVLEEDRNALAILYEFTLVGKRAAAIGD